MGKGLELVAWRGGIQIDRVVKQDMALVECVFAYQKTGLNRIHTVQEAARDLGQLVIPAVPKTFSRSSDPNLNLKPGSIAVSLIPTMASKGFR